MQGRGTRLDKFLLRGDTVSKGLIRGLFGAIGAKAQTNQAFRATTWGTPFPRPVDPAVHQLGPGEPEPSEIAAIHCLYSLHLRATTTGWHRQDPSPTSDTTGLCANGNSIHCWTDRPLVSWQVSPPDLAGAD